MMEDVYMYACIMYVDGFLDRRRVDGWRDKGLYMDVCMWMEDGPCGLDV